MDSNAEVALGRRDLQLGSGLIEKNGHLVVIKRELAARNMCNPEEIATVAPFGWPVDLAVALLPNLAPGGQRHR